MRSLHETDDQLELYALDRLPDDAVERIEEHLILCDPCRTRLEEIGEFALTMRQALRPSPLGAVPRQRGWFEGWNLRFALGGALAIAILLAAVAYRGTNNKSHRNFAPVATLTLTAFRGATAVAVPSREFDLTLTGATGDNLTVELVEATGKILWTGAATTENGNARVRARKELEPGTYFVRLNSASGQMLHEYGLEIRPN